MIVCGTKDNSLRERLLRETDLTLSRAISAGHAAEETRKHAREIQSSNPTADLHRIHKHEKFRKNPNTENSKDFIKKCKFCDKSHPRGKCPAYGKICSNCKKKNHFKVCCPNKKNVHEIEESFDEQSSDEYEFFVDTIKVENPISLNVDEIKNENSYWMISISSNGTPISYKIDTGAECNVLPSKIFEKLKPQPKFR